MVNFKFEELVVYKKAVDFADKIYSLTNGYPKDELFGLTNQLRRAAVSISLNMAEGSARTRRDFSRFIDMARGSVYECVAILRISFNHSYINNSVFEEFKEYLAEISKMLSGLKRSMNTE